MLWLDLLHGGMCARHACVLAMLTAKCISISISITDGSIWKFVASGLAVSGRFQRFALGL